MLHAIISACWVDLQYGKRRDRNRRGKERNTLRVAHKHSHFLLESGYCVLQFSLCAPPGGGSAGAGSAQPAPCLGKRETWSSKANLCFLVFRMHPPQKPCSCLSLWKSCGQREKVPTCVCLCACASQQLCFHAFLRGNDFRRAPRRISGPVCLLCNCKCLCLCVSLGCFPAVFSRSVGTNP